MTARPTHLPAAPVGSAARLHWRHRLAAAAALTLALGSSPVWAAGVEYPDNGTLSIGRGGAWAANPRDGLALQYNPAGLTQQRGLNLYLDARMSNQQVSFEASDPIAGQKLVENGSAPFLGPSAALVWGLGATGPLSDLSLALGGTGPSAIGKLDYPKEGAERYALYKTDYFISYASASVAAAWHDWLRVGVTGQLVTGSARFDQAVWSGFGKGSDSKVDTVAVFDGSGGPIPTAVVGLSIVPNEQWAFGLSWRPHIRFEADGTLVTTAPASAKDFKVTQLGTSATLELDFADIIRLGAQYKPTPTLEVEVNAVWERWSVMKQIAIRTHDIWVQYEAAEVDKVPVPDIVFPKNFKDAYSIRAGLEWTALAERLQVRGGWLLETSAVPTEYVGVEFPNWGRQVASIGASLQLYGAWLDLAYAHHFIDTQEVTGSKSMQVVTPALPKTFLPAAEASTIGNGTYKAALDIVSLSLRVPLQKLRAIF